MGYISNPRVRVRDRISELPDSLITHILSFLDTKLAVRTSVLSTKWKKQWTRVPRLKFGPEDYPGINRVLLFRCSSNIQEFSLSLIEAPVDFAIIDDWICTVIWRNVVELDLLVKSGLNMQLPQSIFTCKTLKVLKLRSNFIVNPPATGCFPSLKVLYVYVPFVNNDDNLVLEKIFSNCPVLEELTIDAYLRRPQACDCYISAPELKMMNMYLVLVSYVEEDLDNYNFYINAPKLVNFDLVMNDMSAFLFHIDANSHFKANIRLHTAEEEYDSKIAILDTISSVKHLSLSCSCAFRVLTNFDNLTRLDLNSPFNLRYWEILIEFLDRSPNLEDLVIRRQDGGCQYDKIHLPKFVPNCMLTHLKTITFDNFKGKRDEMFVAKFLLKYSKLLKTMTVFTEDLQSAKEKAIDKKFLKFERGSNTCQVVILN